MAHSRILHRLVVASTFVIAEYIDIKAKPASGAAQRDQQSM